jgi:hypothetical protein
MRLNIGNILGKKDSNKEVKLNEKESKRIKETKWNE